MLPFLDRAVVERIEVVEHGDAPAVGEQRINEMAADESGATRYQGMFHGSWETICYLWSLRAPRAKSRAWL